MEQPGGKDDDEDIRSGVSGKSNISEHSNWEKKPKANALINDKFEEEFVDQAKSNLDDSILEPDP